MGMCDICRKNPCDKKCPNTDDSGAVLCNECGATIYIEQVRYTDFEHHTFCSESCALYHYGVTEYCKED